MALDCQNCQQDDADAEKGDEDGGEVHCHCLLHPGVGGGASLEASVRLNFYGGEAVLFESARFSWSALNVALRFGQSSKRVRFVAAWTSSLTLSCYAVYLAASAAVKRSGETRRETRSAGS